MCKILVMNGVKDRKLARKFLNEMAVLMSVRNDDGIGYTAVDSKGNIFTEKWVNNFQFLETDTVMTPLYAKKLLATGLADRLPWGALDTNYEIKGERKLHDLVSITMHTRFATTGDVNIMNTHPFIYKGISLIHNGGISNHKELKLNKVSECDSEAALQTYIDNNVINDMKASQDWIDKLKGRWAFGIIGKNDAGVPILDVLRGGSNLYFAEIENLGRVFATDDDDIKAAAKKLKLNLTTEPQYVKQHMMYRYNAQTGEFIEGLELQDSVLQRVVHTPVTHYNNEYWRNRDYYSAYDDYDYTTRDTPTNLSTTTEETTTVPVTSELPSTTSKGARLIREQANELAPFLAQQPEYPNVFDTSDKGDIVFSTKKVIDFVKNFNEDLVTRLFVWDDFRVNTRYLDMYDNLTIAQQDMIEDMDFEEGFFYACKLIQSLATDANGNIILKQQKA